MKAEKKLHWYNNYKEKPETYLKLTYQKDYLDNLEEIFEFRVVSEEDKTVEITSVKTLFSITYNYKSIVIPEFVILNGTKYNVIGMASKAILIDKFESYGMFGSFGGLDNWKCLSIYNSDTIRYYADDFCYSEVGDFTTLYMYGGKKITTLGTGNYNLASFLFTDSLESANLKNLLLTYKNIYWEKIESEMAYGR